MRKIYLISFVTLTSIAAACGGKGDESDGGDGDGDVGDGDGDVGDGDGDVGDGDGDVGDGDGDVGDGDVGDGGMGGTSSTGGDTGLGGGPGTGGDPGTGGEPSTDGGCSGTAPACSEQGEDTCIVAGCTVEPGCSGEAGCEALDTVMECNSTMDALDCTYGVVCSGTPDDCTDHLDGVSCENVGCTWTDN